MADQAGLAFDVIFVDTGVLHATMLSIPSTTAVHPDEPEHAGRSTCFFLGR